MNWAMFYFILALISAVATLAALLQIRRIHFMVTFYFMLGWFSGEMAALHLVWQLALTAALAVAGVLTDPLAQGGLALFAGCWLGKLYLLAQAMDAPCHLQAALTRALGPDYRGDIPRERQRHLRTYILSSQWLRPFRYRRPGVRLHEHLPYGEAGERNLLDIYQPEAAREGGYPVLLQVHGGAWIVGSKREQARPLMFHMAERGWLCVSINYRLSPKSAFPAHVVDVKKAIAWVREHIAEYGGNPDFIAITGGSAGGHLSSLAALTPNLREWQPGFEEADTRVQAAVPFYGVYDFLDRYDIRGAMGMDGFIADRVMQCSREENPTLWEQGSSLSQVNGAAPPFFVIHGTHDSLIWVEEARVFASALRWVSANPVAYAELPGAQHAFEVFHSIRTDHTVNAVAEFLEWCHARWLQVSAAG